MDAHINTDKTVKYDFDIVYVARRAVTGTDGKGVAPSVNAAEPENLHSPPI